MENADDVRRWSEMISECRQHVDSGGAQPDPAELCASNCGPILSKLDFLFGQPSNFRRPEFIVEMVIYRLNPQRRSAGGTSIVAAAHKHGIDEFRTHSSVDPSRKSGGRRPSLFTIRFPLGKSYIENIAGFPLDGFPHRA
jgi:hypothetical protein